MNTTVTNFKKGDLVHAPYYGYGIITNIIRDHCYYPIIVTWYGDKDLIEPTSSFTKDGYMFFGSRTDSNLKITVVERIHNYRKLLNRFREFLEGQ